MSGAAPWSTMHGAQARGHGIPMPVAVSVWALGAAAVGVALVVLAGGDVQAEAPSSPPATPLTTPSLSVTHGGVLPDGRAESGSYSIAAGHVRASLPVRHEPSLYGWGTVRLDAQPLEDEITVRTIVDAPTSARRWSAQCDVVLRVDGDEVRVRAQPVGTRMKSGVFYDALRFELGIDTIRRLARADRVDGTICGDPLALAPVQRATLEDFVRGFDDLALPVLPSRETELETMPTDPDELVDDPDTYLEPA